MKNQAKKFPLRKFKPKKFKRQYKVVRVPAASLFDTDQTNNGAEDQELQDIDPTDMGMEGL